MVLLPEKQQEVVAKTHVFELHEHTRISVEGFERS
jgi:hypothetical protein